MSELMNARSGKRDLRWQLLTTVSTVALLAVMYGAGESKAADQDDDRPTVWIELGGQLEQLQDKQQPFMPPFVANMPSDFFSPDEFRDPQNIRMELKVRSFLNRKEATGSFRRLFGLAVQRASNMIISKRPTPRYRFTPTSHLQASI